ncbi:HepT-like ribonuclease domain-containing protein [Fictibacillus phosphorivorans]
MPQTSRRDLQQNDIITMDLCKVFKAMVDFRNVAVHDY